MSTVKVSVCEKVWVDTEVQVEAKDIIEKLSAEEALELCVLAGIARPAIGDGDAERQENLIERAYLATKRLPSVPRDLADFFWLVHGRAVA